MKFIVTVEIETDLDTTKKEIQECLECALPSMPSTHTRRDLEVVEIIGARVKSIRIARARTARAKE